MSNFHHTFSQTDSWASIISNPGTFDGQTLATGAGSFCPTGLDTDGTAFTHLPDCDNGDGLYNSPLKCYVLVDGADPTGSPVSIESKGYENLADFKSSGLFETATAITATSPANTAIGTAVFKLVQPGDSEFDTMCGKLDTATGSRANGFSGATFMGVYTTASEQTTLTALVNSDEWKTTNDFYLPGPGDRFQCSCGSTNVVAWIVDGGWST